MRLRTLIGLLFFSGCAEEKTSATAGASGELDRSEPVVGLPSPTLRRLTRSQYLNAITALLGDDLVLPSNLEPDETTDGLLAIGAALTTISPRGTNGL